MRNATLIIHRRAWAFIVIVALVSAGVMWWFAV